VAIKDILDKGHVLHEKKGKLWATAFIRTTNDAIDIQHIIQLINGISKAIWVGMSLM